MLTPAHIQQADAVRAKLAVLFMQAIELEVQLEMTGKNSCLRFIKNGLE
ncbi:MAG: hypothetical protein WCP96_14085 [Methylococcaceae bacterium]